MSEPGGGKDATDEARLFESLCELDATARTQRLEAIEAQDPAMAGRLRRLLAIDEAYVHHTARSVLSTELPDPVGDVSDIGAFRLVRQIGRGGMGVVYLAERRSGFSQQVAIKILPRFATDEAGRERFAQERRILAQLRHPNICSILDGGELDDGTPWLAMEYVAGEPLCAWCERRGVDLRGRIALFLDLCEAVQYAHRNLVIHRDLKDSNVLVDEAGRVKLLDFGIAKSISPAEAGEQTALHDRFFSPMTAAPEQLRGERATVATDTYALGALLHQLLTGVLPFERRALPPLELQRAILEEVPQRMSDILQREVDDRRAQVREGAPGAPAPHAPATATPASHAIAPRELRGELDAIVAHCLRKDADERYAEIGDLVRDLRAWRSGHPISIAQGDRLYRTRKFLSRHRLSATIAAIATVGVLGALAVTLWQAAALRTERDVAEAARHRSEVDRDRALAVAAFMRGTFEEADPGRTGHSGLLARELIDRGARQLAGLSDQKDIQAELALMLAESHYGMGQVEESVALLQTHAKAIATLAAVDPDVRWRASSLRLANRIRIGDDGPTLDAELDALRRLADIPQEHAQAAVLQSRLLARRSQFGDAARTLETALRTQGAGLLPPQTLQLKVDLGNALLSADREADARRLCEGLARESIDGYSPALQTRVLRLVVRELRSRDDNSPAYMDALVAAVNRWRDTSERLYGPDALETAKAYENMIDLIADPDERDALMDRAYEIQRRKLPLLSIERAYAEYNRGFYELEFHNRWDRAEPYVASAVHIAHRVSGRGHADALTFEATWAKILNALGRHRACLDLLSSPKAEPEYESDARTLSRLHIQLAIAASALGNAARARSEAEAVVALWRRRGEPVPENLMEQVARFGLVPDGTGAPGRTADRR